MRGFRRSARVMHSKGIFRPRRVHLGGIFENPAVMNGEDIVREPQHVRLIALFDPGHFLDHRFGRSAPVRLSIDGMAAPVAVIRTAARGDHGNGARAVMLAPDLQVARNVYAFAVRPRLGIEVGNELRGTGAEHRAVRTREK